MASADAASEAATAEAADAVFSNALLLQAILKTMELPDLMSCFQLGRVWREQVAVAMRAWTAQQAPALGAALRDVSLSPAACMAVACRAGEATVFGVRMNRKSTEELMADYALLVTVHDSLGAAVFGAVLPLDPGCDFMVSVSAAGPTTQSPARAVSMPPVSALPDAPQSIGMLGLRYTGARDVSELRLSVDVMRHSTAEVARLWRDEPPEGLCSHSTVGMLWQRQQTSGTGEPALYFKLKHSIPQGKIFKPACFMDPLMDHTVRALHLDAFLTLQPLASSPAGAQLCLLPRVAMVLRLADINGPSPFDGERASPHEVLTVLQSLDWEPLVAPRADAEPTSTIEAELAALSLEPDSDENTQDAACCALRWPAHMDALQQLLKTPPSVRNRWLSSLPRRPFTALQAACDAACEEGLPGRYRRLLKQPNCRLSLLVQLHFVCKDPAHTVERPVFGAACPIFDLDGTQRIAYANTQKSGSVHLPVLTPLPPHTGRLALVEDSLGGQPSFGVYSLDTQKLMHYDEKTVQAFVLLLRHNEDGSLQVAELAHRLPLARRVIDLTSSQEARKMSSTVMFTTEEDALKNSRHHSYMNHPVHVILSAGMAKMLRQEDRGVPAEAALTAESLRTFVPQFVTFGLNFTFSNPFAGFHRQGADGAECDVFMSEPNGVFLGYGMELRPRVDGGEPALFFDMSMCLDDVVRRLDWFKLLPAARR